MMFNVCIWGITKGKGSGIGFEIGEYLGLRNFPIVGVVRDREKEVPRKCKAVLQLSDCGEDNQELYLQFLKEHNVQVVISCVGGGYTDNFLSVSDARIIEMVTSNFWINVKMLQWSIRHLSEVSGAKIIILGTIAAVHPEQGSPIYSGTKAGFRAVVESLRHELLPLQLPISMLHFNSVPKIDGKLNFKDICDAVEYMVYSRAASELILY